MKANSETAILEDDVADALDDEQEQKGERQIIKLRFTGTSPLLVNSERGVNPFDPLVRQKKTLTAKRSKKTDEDQIEISRLEWTLAMYHDAKMGPFIPAANVEASLRDGAKLERRGPDIERGLQCIDAKIKLNYIGPRDLDKLWAADGRFVDVRSVRQQRARIMKSRPIFRDWSIEFTLVYDDGILNADDVLRIAELAGKYCGIGDARRLKFGRYEVQIVKNGA